MWRKPKANLKAEEVQGSDKYETLLRKNELQYMSHI